MRQKPDQACVASNRACGLGQSQEWMKSLFAHNLDGVFSLDCEGRFTAANPACEKISGYTCDELLKMTFMELCTPDCLSETIRAFDEDRDGHSAVVETSIIAKDGHQVELLATGGPIYDEGKIVGVFGIVKDITERNRIERALRESEEQFRLLVEGVKDYALFLLDPKGNIINWNKGAERLKGYRAEEIIGRSSTLCFVPEDVISGDPRRRLEMAAERGHYRWEGWVVRKDGSRFWADVLLTALRNEDGTLRGFAEVAQDITERKQAEEALRESEEKFRTIAEHVRAAFGIVRGERFVYANPYFAQLSGYSVEEILSMDFPQMVHPDFQPIMVERARRRQRGEPVPDNYEFLMLTKSGEARWVDFSGARIEYQGQPAIIGVGLDVTERKRAEAALRESEAQLTKAKEAAEAANKAKDHFLAVLSHELRTPLTPVLTSVQMAERELSLSEDLRESLSLIHRNVELEARLIDDLLDVTRISRGKIELHQGPVDLHSVLRHVVEVCNSDVRAKQLGLRVELTAPHHHVHGDSARLQQVFWNLLKNAIKFTPTGGGILLRTEQSDADHAVVIVEDNGVGIDPALLPHIFNVFEQGGQEVTRLFGGLGLGLSISKGLVEMHGGTLRASSRGKDQGATFAVELPISLTAERGSGQCGFGAHPSALPKGGRLLLVEDHPDTARTMAMLLRSFGYDVRIADSVGAALHVADAEEFDLLISDLGLPDGSGLDLMRQISVKHPIKGIAVSGYGMEEDVRRSKEAGFAAHLTKPINTVQLEETIAQISGGGSATRPQGG